jgi:hypothetical protein
LAWHQSIWTFRCVQVWRVQGVCNPASTDQRHRHRCQQACGALVAASAHRYCCRSTCDAATFAPATLQASVRSGHKRASLIPVPAPLGTEARSAAEPMEVGEEPALSAVPEPLQGAKAAAAPNSTPKAALLRLAISRASSSGGRMYETRLHSTSVGRLRYLCAAGLRACSWAGWHSRGRGVWFLGWLRVMR